MKYDFVFDVIRNKDFAEYYKTLNLTVFQLEAIIMSCHKPLFEKLDLLKRFEKEVDAEYKKDIGDMVKLYEILLNIYENPKTHFGQDTIPVYSCGTCIYECDINTNVDYYENFALNIMYFNGTDCAGSLSDAEQIMCYPEYSYNIDLYIIKNGKFDSTFMINYYCFGYNNSKCIPYYCEFYDTKCIYNDKLKCASERYMGRKHALKYIGLPFPNKSKIKFQLPFMKEPNYGILKSELDGNNCWYNFMHKKDKTESSNTNFIDLSYTDINLVTNFAVFDWIELV